MEGYENSELNALENDRNNTDRGLKNAHPRLNKFKNVALALVLAGGMAISMSACTSFGGDGTTPGNDGTTPGGGNGTTSGGNNSEYSQILENVINSPYYNEVIDDYINSNNKDTQNAEAPIPYTFLEREGLDVNAIKNDQLECESVAYIMNNDTSKLYLSTRAESAEGYYANYVLSYQLTEQEYNDLYMLHEDNYIQSGLFIQELDAQKNAKVESHVNVEKDTFNGLEGRIQYLCDDYIDNEYVYIDVTSANEDAEFTLNVRSAPASRKNMIIENQELRKMNCSSSDWFYNYTNQIFSLTKMTMFDIDNLDEFKANYESITYFDSQRYHNPYTSIENELNK